MHRKPKRYVLDSKQGSPVGLEPFWTVCSVSYLLNTPYAGGPGYIQQCEIDSGTLYRVELSQPVLHPHHTRCSLSLSVSDVLA